MNTLPNSGSYRWLLLPLGIAAGVAAASLLAFRIPDRFESHSVLMIAPKARSAGRAADITEDAHKFTETQLQLMLSGQVINRVQARLQEGWGNTNKVLAPRLEAVAGKGNTFILKVGSTNFDYVQQFAIAWAQEFIEFKKQQRQSLLGASEASLQRDALLYERQLERARTALEDFKRKNHVTSLEDAGLRVQQQLEQAKADRQQLLSTLQVIEGITGEQLLTVSDDLRPNRGEERAGAASSSATMFARYIDLRLAVKRAEKRLAALSADAPAPTAEKFKSELRDAQNDLNSMVELAEEQRQVRLTALQVRAGSYEPVIGRLTDEVLQATSMENEYIRLQEDEKIYKDSLDALRRQLANFLSSNGDEEQFQSVEIGGGSPAPVGPNRLWLLAFGGLTGLILGLILTAASAARDRR